ERAKIASTTRRTEPAISALTMAGIRMSNRIEFNLNGAAREIVVDDEMSLLEVLRESFGLISPKDGCSPQGQCGCCTVIVEGRAVVSCAVPARSVAGATGLTPVGFMPVERSN